jgi:hypothetical protein
MHDACRVRFRQSLGYLSQVFQEFGQRRLPTVNFRPQGLAVDVLHGDEVCSAGLSNFVDVRDMGMV